MQLVINVPFILYKYYNISYFQLFCYAWDPSYEYEKNLQLKVPLVWKRIRLGLFDYVSNVFLTDSSPPQVFEAKQKNTLPKGIHSAPCPMAASGVPLHHFSMSQVWPVSLRNIPKSQ